MVSRPVPTQYLTAGQDYLDALVRLGLDPAFLGWAWDVVGSEWRLVLVTSIVESGGPLAINRLLFRAYNAEATPKTISPFVVRVLSHRIIPGGKKSKLWFLGQAGVLNNPEGAETSDEFYINSAGQKAVNFQFHFLGMDFESRNSLLTKWEAVDRAFAAPVERQRQWERFKRNVEKLAA